MLHELGWFDLPIAKETSIINPFSGSKIGAMMSHAPYNLPGDPGAELVSPSTSLLPLPVRVMAPVRPDRFEILLTITADHIFKALRVVPCCTSLTMSHFHPKMRISRNLHGHGFPKIRGFQGPPLSSSAKKGGPPVPASDSTDATDATRAAFPVIHAGFVLGSGIWTSAMGQKLGRAGEVHLLPTGAWSKYSANLPNLTLQIGFVEFRLELRKFLEFRSSSGISKFLLVDLFQNKTSSTGAVTWRAPPNSPRGMQISATKFLAELYTELGQDRLEVRWEAVMFLWKML